MKSPEVQLAELKSVVRAIILDDKTPKHIREMLQAAYEQTQAEND